MFVVFYCLCTCGFRTVCYVSRSSLRKGDPSWSVTLTWSVPLSLTSLPILISSFFCLYVSVFMYVCFSRCYFHETTKGRKRWVLILNRNLSCFLLFPNTIQPTFTCRSPIKGNADSGIQEIFACKIRNPGLWNPWDTAQGLGIPLMIGIRNPVTEKLECAVLTLSLLLHFIQFV